VVEKRFFEITY